MSEFRPIASGVWENGAEWSAYYTSSSHTPELLRQKPKLCTAAGVVVLIDMDLDLPLIPLTMKDEGRDGKPPQWELASGKTDELTDGSRETPPVTAARECMEELGIEVELTVEDEYACREIHNPPTQKLFPPISFMRYFKKRLVWQHLRRLVPREAKHTAQIMSLERIGNLARQKPPVVSASEAKIIGAACIADGYPEQAVLAALGPLPEKDR